VGFLLILLYKNSVYFYINVKHKKKGIVSGLSLLSMFLEWLGLLQSGPLML
jgi:hypothetical protein